MIKNVAGYDLAKLFAGSFGTLGLIVARGRAAAPAARRDRDRGRRRATTPSGSARGRARSPHCRSRPTCLDVDWRDGAGAAAGPLRRRRPRATRRRRRRRGCATRGLDGVQVIEDDDELWMTQRVRQRGLRAQGLRPRHRPRGASAAAAGGRRRRAPRSGSTGSARSGASCDGRGRARRRSPRARARCSTRPAELRARRVGVARSGRAGRDGARSRSASTRPASSVPALSWEASDEHDGAPRHSAWDEHRPPDPDLIADCVHCGYEQRGALSLKYTSM